MNGCEYCKESDEWNPLIEKRGNFFDKKSNFYLLIQSEKRMSIDLDIDGFTVLEIEHKINFCPMCGRKLKEVE